MAGRSNPRRRRPAAPPPGTESSPPSAPSLASATLPRVWQGVGYRPLPDPAAARPLFDFAALPWPPAVAFAWGAFGPGDEGLLGALVAERAARDVFLHGPVALTERDPLEVAAQLVAAALDHATAAGAVTVFARPQGLDRVWVRFGFIPVPESALPGALSGRPGVGLFAWRGGSALWTFRDTAGE